MTVAVAIPEGGGSVPPPRWATWPAVAYLLLVTQLPFLATIYLSVQSWNLQYPQRGVRFVGLQNYVDLIRNGGLPTWLANSVLFSVGPTLISIVLGLGLAALLNNLRYGRSVAYALLLSPFLVMETVSPLIWKNMLLNPVYGILSWLFQSAGLSPIDMVSDWPRSVIIIMVVWQWCPFMMMVLLAGLQSVPGEQIEAATLEGASAVQRFRHVQLPHLTSYITVAALLQIILTLPLFGPIYVATYGGPGDTTTTLMFGTFRILAEQYQVGRAAAAGIVTAAVTTAIMMVLLAYIRPLLDRGTPS